MLRMNTLASRLKEARELRGWTQDQLAKEAGVSQSMVGNAEAGLRTAPNRLPDLADALCVRYRWLKDGTEPMTSEPITWPFKSIPLEDFDGLEPDQKIEVQGVVRRMIADFQLQNGKRDSGDT